MYIFHQPQLSPCFISSYITGEQAASHYSRGFHPKEFKQLIGPFHTSPLGLVPKQNSDAFCMIQNISFPHDHGSIPSVNQGINPDDFPPV